MSNDSAEEQREGDGADRGFADAQHMAFVAARVWGK